MNRDVLYSEKCSRAFRTLILAVLFFLPIRWQSPDARGLGVELFPDAVGWLLIILALGRIPGLHPAVRATKPRAVAGLLLAIPRVVHPVSGIGKYSYIVLCALGGILAFGCVWRLCTIAREAGEDMGDPVLVRHARKVRWVFGVNALLPTLSLLMQDILPTNLPSLGVVYAVLIACALSVSLTMRFMARMSRACTAAPTPEAAPAGDQGDEEAGAPPES
jgi:hypothetical protein